MTQQFSFFRAGGLNQVNLAKGTDLINLDQLDQKLWVALACPTQGLVFDERTLALIDSDGDGRIRVNELTAALKWASALLVDPEILVQATDTLPLEAINTGTPEGEEIARAARTVLAGLGKDEAGSISVADAMAALEAFHKMPFNGDGVITETAATDDQQKHLIADILATTGGEADKSGNPGVSQASVADFSTAVGDYLDWVDAGEQDKALKPLEDTAGALAALAAVRHKIDDFFVRVKLAAFDPRAIAALNREEKEYYAIAARDLALDSEEILHLPLAHVDNGSELPLFKGINPAWLEAMDAFVAKVVTPLLGRTETLSESQWQDIVGRLRNFEAWAAAKPS
jgi:hypothetical protein